MYCLVLPDYFLDRALIGMPVLIDRIKWIRTKGMYHLDSLPRDLLALNK
jgi:hypothetical protein